jgi:hypothetical protein
VSYGSGSCLPTGEVSRAPHVIWLPIMSPYREGSGVATACPAVSCGTRASNIKKNIACLGVQLGSHVYNTRTHVSKAPDVRALMGM